MNLDELIEATRAVDRPPAERTEKIYRTLTLSLGAPGATDPPPAGTSGIDALATTSAGGFSVPLWGKLVLALAIGAGGLTVLRSIDSMKDASSQKVAPLPTGVRKAPEQEPPYREPGERSNLTEEASENDFSGESAEEIPLKRTPSSRKTTAVASASPSNELGTSDALRRELELLRSAKEALNKKDPARAIQVLDEYDREFPSGKLRAEARATRVLALCSLQQDGKAREVGKQIDDDSPLAEHLGSGCRVSKTP